MSIDGPALLPSDPKRPYLPCNVLSQQEKERSTELAEIVTNSLLPLERHGSKQLIGVQAGSNNELLGGLDDTRCRLLLQRLGLESLGDEVEALVSLRHDGWVSSSERLAKTW